jgi:hypothetical protein
MSQHDETKRMLGLIRESNRKRNIIKESRYLINESNGGSSDRDLDAAELVEEEQKFRDNVSTRVSFNRFRLYPKSQNVEFSGKFNDNNIEWFFSLDDSRGVYITADLLQLTDDTLKQLQKLVGYYQTWSNEWGSRISEEYSNDLRNEENEEEGPESLDQTEINKEEEPLS